MEQAGTQPELFESPGPSSGTQVVNGRCVVRSADGQRIVVFAGVVVDSHRVGDRAAEALAMVQLVERGWADQVGVARAFGVSTRTVRRNQRRKEEGGLVALTRSAGYPRGRLRLPATQQRSILRWKASGCSNREVARRLGVTERAVRKQLRRAGWKEPTAEQLSLRLAVGTPGADPNLSAPPVDTRSGAAPAATDEERAGAIERAELRSPGADPNLSAPPVDTGSGAAPAAAEEERSETSGRSTGCDRSETDDEPAAVSMDCDPADRRFDRLLAYLGLLDDAAPLFRSAYSVPRAGVLLALPALCDSGVLRIARGIYGSLGPAFYGLRTTLLALLLMALLRVKRPEALKKISPAEFGQVLGLDRAPEVKTLRRKLGCLAALGRALDFGRALGRQRVEERGAAVGFLYVDGHVRVYHGKHRIPKAHVTQQRLSLPATTDYWVNDQAGDPLFVLTAEANAGLAKMLPNILHEIREVVGPRRTTVVFDRGGYSPRLFQQIIAAGFDLLTYRKGRVPPIAPDRFVRHVMRVDGRQVDYRLADGPVELLGGKLRLRQITRLSDGHQTHILTSREDLPAVELAYRMFERWAQENFLKYLKQEYALDALVDYGVEPDDPERSVPNPARKALEAEIRTARAEVQTFQAAYGAAALVNPERNRPTMRGFKIAHGKIGKALRSAMKRVADLEARRQVVPERVPVKQTTADGVVKLSVERKLLTSIVKMVAYQAESDLVRLVVPHYARAQDEGRALIQAALTSAADIDVRGDELHVRLAPQSAPHRTRALAALCEQLDRADIRYPGTRLRLRYSVAQAA